MKNSFLILLLISTANIFSQNCNCDHVINPTTNYLQFSGSGSKVGNLQKPKVLPGQTICLQAGKYVRLRLDSLVGTPEKPIIIKNCGGLVLVESPSNATYNTFAVTFSKHFKLVGTGDANYKYGIKIVGGNNGLTLGELSTDFEIANIEVANTGFAGIMAKTDPDCRSITWRENFTMTNIDIHDVYTHDMALGEGLYIGNSFYNGGMSRTCDGISKQVYAHAIHNIKVHHNIIKRTGSEGLQIGCATRNCMVYNNELDSLGIAPIPFQPFQNNGLQLGSGTGGKCFNNRINFCPGNGIVCTGIGDNLIYNNLIINSGQTDTTSGSGIFSDEQSTADTLVGKGVMIINNTIINPKDNGLRIYNDRITEINRIYNNIVYKTGTNPEYVRYLNSSVKRSESNNIYRNTLSSIGFIEPEIGDYKLSSTSPAKEAGLNASIYSVMTDFDGFPRSNVYDAGAFVYRPLTQLFDYSEATSKPDHSLLIQLLDLNKITLPFDILSEGNNEIQLINSQGIKIAYLNLTGKNRLDLSYLNLSSGMYLIHFRNSENPAETIRMVVY